MRFHYSILVSVLALAASAIPLKPSSVERRAANPCAVDSTGALPSPGPAYGLAVTSGSSITATVNDLLPISSSQGASAEACCNACNFELENCVQAWWYSYEGCVVQQATVNATAGNATSTCPQGTIAGLVYTADTEGPFRSTGDIVGPCGASYANA